MPGPIRSGVGPVGSGAPGVARPAIADPLVGWRQKITSAQGHREAPGGIYSTNHTGIDIGAPMGTPIQAVKDGKVVHAGPAGGSGNLTVIQHNDGTVTMYAHASEINVQVGQEVKAGDVIAKVGSTGFSTGPHLHFEVRQGSMNGPLLDAMKYLDGAIEVAPGAAGPAQSFGAASGGGGGGGFSGGGGGVSGGGGGVSGGGGSSPSAMSLGAPSSPAPSGPSSAPPPGGKAVAAGDFAALIKRLAALGIDQAWLEELARRYGVPIEMILAVIMQESGGNPNARSPVGAMGLMQLMPGTAASLGVGDPNDPKQNVEGGVKYLAQQLKAFGGDQTKALAAYNAGPGNVQKYDGVPPFAETRTYVANITASMNNAKEAWG